MYEPGTFSPATQHELSATLDVTWRAILETRRIMRLLEMERFRAGERIAQLEKELEQARGRTKEIHIRGEARERQAASEAEQSDARAAMARLAEEKERLQRELAEAREEIESRIAQLATEEQLAAALQTDVSLLHRAMEQLGKRLEDPIAGQLPIPAYQDKRVIWIGSAEFPGSDLLAGLGMESLAVSNPEQALEILSGQGADALITDITAMGIDWLSDVRKRWPELIIIVTAGPDDAFLAVDSPLCNIATTVFTQPYEPQDVVMVVRCALLRKALSSGTEAMDLGFTSARPRLLIAEDDEATRKLLSTCLNQRGYDTTCVEDGVAALEAIKAEDFDVLVTDIQMPRMDGIELTTKAKELKPRLPIIIISAAEEVETSLKAMLAGAYAYIPKPLGMEELSTLIGRAMLVDRLERQLREQGALLDGRTNELDKALHELQKLQEAVKLIASRRQSLAKRAGAPAG